MVHGRPAGRFVDSRLAVQNDFGGRGTDGTVVCGAVGGIRSGKCDAQGDGWIRPVGLRPDETIAGVVHEAGGSETFTAWKNGGAWLNGKRISVSATKKLSDSLVATGFPYNLFDRLDPYMELLSHLVTCTHGVRRLGSASIDLAYVACGRFDVFFEYDLKLWDIAAGMLIVREAGGVFSDFSGNMKNLSGDETVASNRHLFPETIEIIRKFMKSG